MARREEKDGVTVYAVVRWSPEDVQTLRPKWSLEKCEEWLAENAKYIEDGSVEAGWEIIRSLLIGED